MVKKEEREQEIVTPEENILTLVEVAQYLHVHPSTIYRLVKDNELQGFKVGRDWRFNVEQIDKIRLTQETLGARRRTTQSVPPASRRSPPRTERRSSEASQINVSAQPETTPRMDEDDSARSRSSELQFDEQTKVKTTRSGQAPDDSRLRQLEEENRRLKRIVADQALDIQVLKEVLAKRDL